MTPFKSLVSYVKKSLGLMPKPVQEGSFDRMIRMMKEANSTMSSSVSMIKEANQIMDSTYYTLQNLNRIKERIDDISEYGKTEEFKRLCVNDPSKALAIIKEMDDLFNELNALSFDKS